MKGGKVFEIRVAFIGYVSVGKTTVINALFGAEYGEVSMKRTTAVVNDFRISTPAQVDHDNSGTEKPTDSDSRGSVEWSMAVDSPRAPGDSLKQSIRDNRNFRNKNQVKEKSLDIVLDEPLHEMRSDTKLVVVDIPGINEAQREGVYKDFVNEHWHEFDIAVVVMDGRQGVNTEEQMELLKLVKENTDNVKKIPVVILCNKVDDPEDEEQAALLTESRRSIETLFKVPDRKMMLEKILNEISVSTADGPGSVDNDSLLPIVIPVSAMHAFLYRCGGRMTFEEFCKMDKNFIEKIGKESYGRQWRRYDKTKKLEKAFEAVSDEEQRKDGLEASNFDAFLSVLGYCIGDEKRQASLIRQQADIALERMSKVGQDCDLAGELLSAHNKLRVLGESTHALPGIFWTAYRAIELNCYAQFNKEKTPAAFANPVHQLSAYFQILPVVGSGKEKEKVVAKAKEFVHEYAFHVLKFLDSSKKSEKDRSLILGSMLLFSQDWTFAMHLGRLKIELETRYIATNAARLESGTDCVDCKVPTTRPYLGVDQCNSCSVLWIEHLAPYCPFCRHARGSHCKLQSSVRHNKRCKHCTTCKNNFRERPDPHAMTYRDGRIAPVNEELYKKDVSVVVPESPSDPDHFGHVIWKCCLLLKSADDTIERST